MKKNSVAMRAARKRRQGRRLLRAWTELRQLRLGDKRRTRVAVAVWQRERPGCRPHTWRAVWPLRHAPKAVRAAVS